MSGVEIKLTAGCLSKIVKETYKIEGEVEVKDVTAKRTDFGHELVDITFKEISASKSLGFKNE